MKEKIIKEGVKKDLKIDELNLLIVTLKKILKIEISKNVREKEMKIQYEKNIEELN